ncbi:MAG: RNA polymerase sigma factor [Steroidobacteraceae bacterium]
MNSELDQWFSREILPHEAALTRYLNRMWKGPAEVADLRQDTYVRVYERAARGFPRSPRTFLFVTAHNLIVDRVRRERTVFIAYKPDPDSYDYRTDELTPERCLMARHDLQRLKRAFSGLPHVTREVIWLRRIEGLSQLEAAALLGIKEGALEAHMSRGLRNLERATS